MFVEKYIKEPFKYAMSDWKKIFVGVVLSIIGILPLELFSAMLDSLSYSGGRFGTHMPSMGSLTIMIAIFVVLSLFTLMISIVLMGYYISISKNTIESINILPEWENFGTLIKNGFMCYVALLILLFVVLGIPTILMTVLFVGMGYGAHMGDSSYLTGMPNILMIIGTLLFIIILCALILLSIIYIPLATVNFAKKGFKGFFEFKYVFKLMSIKYIVLLITLWIIMVIINTLINAPSIILSILSALSYNVILLYISKVVYAITAGFASFFLSVVYYRALSNYYVDGVKKIGE